ncbi:putative tetratricopeptide-like helical domain superfamily [Helianthus annuus]|nr:putative tetratricopeptide-like helical domain superfamily [Helianthus annuus]
MVLEGWLYFDLMQRVYKIEPKAEHYGCMVDLLSRVGLMKDSEAMMVAKRLIELEPNDVGPYVLLSNIYATAERWDDVENVREMMVKNGLQKPVGSSLVQPGNDGVKSVQGGYSFHKRRLMYSMLSDMGVQIIVSKEIAGLGKL